MTNICEYPTFWEYKIFVDLDFEVQTLIDEKLFDLKYEILDSKQNQKYKSLNIKVFVDSKKQRDEIFLFLKNKCKFVL